MSTGPDTFLLHRRTISAVVEHAYPGLCRAIARHDGLVGSGLDAFSCDYDMALVAEFVDDALSSSSPWVAPWSHLLGSGTAVSHWIHHYFLASEFPPGLFLSDTYQEDTRAPKPMPDRRWHVRVLIDASLPPGSFRVHGPWLHLWHPFAIANESTFFDGIRVSTVDMEDLRRALEQEADWNEQDLKDRFRFVSTVDRYHDDDTGTPASFPAMRIGGGFFDDSGYHVLRPAGSATHTSQSDPILDECYSVDPPCLSLGAQMRLDNAAE